MNKFQRISAAVVAAGLILGLGSIAFTSSALARPRAAATSFHFEFSADSRDNYTVLPDFSHKMVTFSPVFGFFGGDLCGSLSTTCINGTWKPAMDGNNSDGMLGRTFVGRGNHDAGTLSTWQGLWDFSAMAAGVGATHYTAQTSDATYSFDYGNSHFVVVDNASSGAAGWTSTQISWFDSDLAAAESRGIVHEFLSSHGPMYPVTSEHSGDVPSSALKAVLNKHPRLIGFHGHEHITAYTLVTPSFESGINNFPQFTLGRAGAPAYTVDKAVTWKSSTNAFADVSVSDDTVTVNVYSQSGSLLYTQSFTHSGTAPTAVPPTATSVPPTAQPTNVVPTATYVLPTATSSAVPPTPQPTSVAPTPTPGGSGGTGTYVSTAAYDGYVLESSETSNQGGTVNATGTTFRVGDDASNRQYRAVLSFDTSGLPDNATITSVTLKFKQAGSGGSNPYSTMGNIMADIISGSFSGSPTLQAADFQATANKNSAMSIGNTPSNGWYTKSMNLAYAVYVNKTGITQLRLRFATDDNNNKIADYLAFYTGNAGTASNRPTLTIKYTVP